MRVIITGLPLFSKRMADDLNEFTHSKQFIYLNTYYSKWDQIKFICLLPFVSGVVSMNGVSSKSGILDYVCLWGKKIWMQWMGTDILLANDRSKNKTINTKYIERACHWVDAPWMQQELADISIASKTIDFKFLSNIPTTLKKYKKLEVCTYIPQNRQEFYGMHYLCELAKAHPEIDFHVYGTKNPDEFAPKNVICWDWQPTDVLHQKMSESAVFLRLTKHDGYSVSVIEAMSLGCEVVSFFPFDKAHVVTETSILPTFAQVIQEINERGLTPNFHLQEYYQNKYKKTNVLTNLYNELKNYFEK